MPENAELFMNCLEAIVEMCPTVPETNGKEQTVGNDKRIICNCQSDSISKVKPSTITIVHSHTSSEIDTIAVHVE
jgi:hypothetical protein